MVYRISEACNWLTQETGEPWTDRTLLAAVMGIGARITATPPIGTKFGVYLRDRDNASAANPFVRQCDAPWQPTIPLWPRQIEQLFHADETTASIAEHPDDKYGQPGQYIFVEPLESSLHITLSMVRIPVEVMRTLAARINETRTGARNRNADESAIPDPLVSMPTAKVLRDGPLDAVIEIAIKAVMERFDRRDPQTVWNHLVGLAASKESRPDPLLGYVEEEGIKYRSDRAPNGVAHLTFEMLRKRKQFRPPR